MTCQGKVEASNRWGLDAYLLVQQLDGRIASTDSLRTADWVLLAVTLSADDVLRDLGKFSFAASHLFSAGRRHVASIAKLLRLIKILGELYTKVQGMITYPHLATVLLFDMSRS